MRASLTTCARVGDGGCAMRVPGRRDARRGERRAELVTRPARRDDVHRQCYASHRSREKNRVKGRWWCRRCGRAGDVRAAMGDGVGEGEGARGARALGASRRLLSSGEEIHHASEQI